MVISALLGNGGWWVLDVESTSHGLPDPGDSLETRNVFQRTTDQPGHRVLCKDVNLPCWKFLHFDRSKVTYLGNKERESILFEPSDQVKKYLHPQKTAPTPAPLL